MIFYKKMKTLFQSLLFDQTLNSIREIVFPHKLILPNHLTLPNISWYNKMYKV